LPVLESRAKQQRIVWLFALIGHSGYNIADLY
jgi:hypothetical protein